MPDVIAIGMITVFFVAMITEMMDRRRRHEHRRTEENNHYSRTDHGTGFITSSTNTTITYTASNGTVVTFGAGTGPRVDLPVEHQDDAVLGWKAATIARPPDSNQWGFQPLTPLTAGSRNLYPADAYARCLLRPMLIEKEAHDVPDPSCSCGFYAVKAYSDVVHVERNAFTLRVELTGLVIECETGYRARRQRVLDVVVPRCYRCFQPNTSAILEQQREALGGGFVAIPLCANCARAVQPHSSEWAGAVIPLSEVLTSLGVPRHYGEIE